MNRIGLFAIAGAVALFFAPILPHFTTAAIGDAGSDSLKHVWSQWWVILRLMEDGTIPLHTTLIHHPIGGAFWSLDTVNALIGLPLRAVLGPVATYNAVLILDLCVAAWAAMRLAREFTEDVHAQTIAGVGFAFSAWVLSFPVASGVSETAFFFPIPLVILLAIHTWRTPGWGTPIAAGLLLAIQGLGCWSHGISLGLILLGMGAHAIRTDGVDPDRIKRLALGLFTALLITIPAYLAIRGTVSGEAIVKTRALSIFPGGGLSPLAVPEANSMALLDFFLPGSAGLRINLAGTEQLMYAAYPGWILLGLAIIGFRAGTRHARLLAVGAILFAFLAMGPRMYLDHARSWPGIPNPVYLIVYWVVPLANATIHSVDRFMIGVQLCVSMLAAGGATVLLQRFSVHRWAAPALVAAVLAEAAFVSPAPWPSPMVRAQAHPASIVLAEEPGPGAVIDLPYLLGEGPSARFDGDVFLQQTVHGRPIPFHLEGAGIETASASIRANPFFARVSTMLTKGQALPKRCDGATSLGDLGFRWIVWHKRGNETVTGETVHALLEHCLGPGRDIEDRTLYLIGS